MGIEPTTHGFNFAVRAYKILLSTVRSKRTNCIQSKIKIFSFVQFFSTFDLIITSSDTAVTKLVLYKAPL